jgi:hypothetical protein
VQDVRARVAAADSTASPAYLAGTKALRSVRAWKDALLSDLLTQHGDSPQHRALYGAWTPEPMPPMPPPQTRARGGAHG